MRNTRRKALVSVFAVFLGVAFFLSGVLTVPFVQSAPSALLSSAPSAFASASFFDFIRAFVTINPLAIEVSLPTEVEISKNFKVEVIVINKGDVKIENTKGEIFLPVGLSLLGKDAAKNIGIVRGGRQKKLSWSVKGGDVGKYVISVSVFGEVSGDFVSAEGSKLVLVNEKSPPRGRPPGIFQFFSNLFQGWF